MRQLTRFSGSGISRGKRPVQFSNENAADASLLRRLMRGSDSDMVDSLEKEKLNKRILILEEFQEKSMELLELYREELKKEDKETIK